MNGASTKDNFDKIADKIENTKKDGGNVLISCEESTGLAATLSIAYSIKYEGISVKNASKTVSKKRPNIYLD
jgi:protein-tyrosine phosphatase